MFQLPHATLADNVPGNIAAFLDTVPGGILSEEERFSLAALMHLSIVPTFTQGNSLGSVLWAMVDSDQVYNPQVNLFQARLWSYQGQLLTRFSQQPVAYALKRGYREWLGELLIDYPDYLANAHRYQLEVVRGSKGLGAQTPVHLLEVSPAFYEFHHASFLPLEEDPQQGLDALVREIIGGAKFDIKMHEKVSRWIDDLSRYDLLGSETNRRLKLLMSGCFLVARHNANSGADFAEEADKVISDLRVTVGTGRSEWLAFDATANKLIHAIRCW